jgi:adenylate cyclase
MSAPHQGSREVEQTLRLARDGVERDIARYRVWVFTSGAVLTAGLRVVGLGDLWTPALFFLGALGYALVLRAFVERSGHRLWLAVIALIVDLGTVAGVFHIVHAFDASTGRAGDARFAVYIVAPALLLTLLINVLRSSAACSLVGAVAAPAVFLGTAVPIAGFHPAQVSVSALLVLAGLIGLAASRQARKSLDSFARLQLLRRYLPPAAVERIMREDPDAATALGGRLVTVTLLAADLRGFTAMSEKLSPREVMAQLNAYHAVMIDVIEQHGGAIDKFIGDGTLVVFGLTGGVEEAAASAVTCARAMLAALAGHNEARARAGAPPLRMGIGVHTGPVIAGNLGVPGRRLEFTVIGDAVNTASRLEGETKTCGSPVIVSAATALLLPDTRALRELAPVSLRGKEDEIRVYGLAGGEGARGGEVGARSESPGRASGGRS